MLGLTILYRQTNSDYEKDEYSIDDLMQQLNIAKSILNFYGSTNTISYRLHTIVLRLINTLTLQAQPQDENDELLSYQYQHHFKKELKTSHYPKCIKHNLILGTDRSRESIFNTPLENIINFQQFLFLRPLIQKTIIVAGFVKRV